MNFLAHIFLSSRDEDILLGNLIADFIRNKEVANYSLEIQSGIFLHRQIDSFTDNHPTVREGTTRLRTNHRKYAPVVIDILYDHLLAKNWHRYANVPFVDFKKEVYDILRRRIDELPLKLQNRLISMIDHNWLASYQTINGMQFVFDRMDQRTSFPSQFYKATEDLKRDYVVLTDEFNTFFPEVIEFVTDLYKPKKGE